jgi:hypothetical protein
MEQPSCWTGPFMEGGMALTEKDFMDGQKILNYHQMSDGLMFER